ncbi:MAG: hypothetical protein ACRC4M_01840 [Mycoplasma sp.]
MIYELEIVNNIMNKDGFTIFEKDGNNVDVLLSFPNKKECDIFLSKLKSQENLLILPNSKIHDADDFEDLFPGATDMLIPEYAQPDDGTVQWTYLDTELVISSYPESFKDDKESIATLFGVAADTPEFENDISIINGEKYIEE